MLSEWAGPFGGVPPFDRAEVAQFKPALEAGMAEQLGEIDNIAKDPAAPTFENTIAALERAGRTLVRVTTVYGVWSSTMNAPHFQAVQREMMPRLAAFGDKITQNEALFKRIEAVYNSPAKSKLTSEQQRLTWLYYTNFVRSGAKLDAQSKARLSEINLKLAGLYTNFNQHLLSDENDVFLTLKSEDELAGLPQSLRDAAAAAAASKKQPPGTWVILNTRSSVDPFLTYSDRRDLRERVWRMFVNRGDNADKNDNKAIITEILQLRAERAKLLGYQTHAHWRLENAMAKTPDRVMELIMQVWKPAVARVREEVADMQALADKEGAKIKIEPWDYRYYMEKVRKAKYDLDQNEVKQYLQLDKLREGIFWVAGELFNFKFTPAANIPTYHPDVKVWEVTDRTSGKHIGLWYFDPYAREGKRSGVWMNAYRSQERMDREVTTIVSNNANFVKGKPGEPVLISWDDATTMFHEFGHALHGLSSNVTYPTLAGTAVARDYVEFPSQLLEHWLSTPEVLQRFALHYQTGKPIPQALVDKIKRADTFNQGFATVEYLSSALVDMKLHLAGSQRIDPDAFEKKTLAELGMPSELVMRHRTPQFGLVFASDSYSAGYYSYLWSDVFTADAFGAFVEGDGPYDKKVAERLRKYIFSVGNTVDPAEAYRSFRGRDPRVEALMRKRGFPVSAPQGNLPEPSSQDDSTSVQIDKVAKDVKASMIKDVNKLRVRSVLDPNSGNNTKKIEVYEAQAVSNVLTKNKTYLLQELPGQQLEGLRSYIDRVFPSPLQLKAFRVGGKLFVERQAADELLAKAKEVVELVDISDAEVEIVIKSDPDDATFRLLSFDGKAVQDICTNGCPVRIFRGDYKYEIVRAGYKRKTFDFPLVNRAPRLKLDCHMVKEDEANAPPPCKETEEN